MLKSAYFSEFVLPARWEGQAKRQVTASGGRDLDWFFAEPEAARAAQRLFSNTPGLETIQVFHMPAIAP